MIHAAITSLNSSEKGHKIPMTSIGAIIRLSRFVDSCYSSCTLSLPMHRNYRVFWHGKISMKIINIECMESIKFICSFSFLI